MANFEAFLQSIKLSTNLLFLHDGEKLQLHLLFSSTKIQIQYSSHVSKTAVQFYQGSSRFILFIKYRPDLNFKTQKILVFYVKKRLKRKFVVPQNFKSKV